MKAFLENPLVLLGLTFVVYYGVQMLQQRYKLVFLNPVLLAVSVLIGYLLVFNISYETYKQAGTYIEFWLKPSIVALGVPLYLQLSKIKKQLIPLIISEFVGSLVGIISVTYIAKLLGAENDILKSLAPKSVTTPIALEISNTLGGISSLTVASVIVTGILGAILGFKVLQFSQVKSPMGRGISLGTASHALGIMAAFNLSEKHAIYASLGMIFNGVFTAILAPIVMPFILT
ncbi:MAG: LrgB family protein [Capnocytophaga sp.]|nr:LrgB family protein [Capnocytophaga sp.]